MSPGKKVYPFGKNMSPVKKVAKLIFDIVGKMTVMTVMISETGKVSRETGKVAAKQVK